MTETGVDPVTAALRAEGIVVEPWSEDAAYPILSGMRVRIGTAEIVYRLYDPQTVFIVLLTSSKRDGALGSPLEGMTRLVAFLAARRPGGVRRIAARIDTRLFRDPDGITDSRLTRYCTGYLGARSVREEVLPSIHDSWVSLEFDDFVPKRRHRPLAPD